MSRLTNQQDFSEVLQHIQQARQSVFTNVNTALIALYWHVGKTISHKVQNEAWGKGVVSELARYISQHDPDVKGFSDKNLWRMKQFYETYQADEQLIPLVKQLPWTHNTIIFSRCKTAEERQFYLKQSIKERYASRELERQIDSAQFERMSMGNQKLSALLRELHPTIGDTFKDSYVLEFLGLPPVHSENRLQKALVQHMRQFILELGKDFIFIGEEYRLQVGNQDFFIDLLFFHRGLSALVAFELKIGKFLPEHLGQLNFYLEALDRDVKKPHENPSIGVLLCRDKDDEVVEYALSRNLSPTLIAEYQLQLPDKKLLQAKLHGLCAGMEDGNE
ncbi:MAG TPA: PDDEXK nuclease domain-containing protein [Candidatus Thiothrix moscowensis]|uniref:PDDEXK nuclease domain-containing protein n=1 Tax=unclassified Thiothrix TaxID=2636184 RepID=UPI0025D7C484|nr:MULTISPECIES: PDDEXK nuclease domain-containing protein [unclassified Thiothrix]HRJ51525.1 PDDEXK nuclease domain-containing protein [Candidatus Thiothrix moscowensis]HRJ91840.1 PDDEXK nuclease domain-containing protein [Candidatus Thiothrix moscowensis]